MAINFQPIPTTMGFTAMGCPGCAALSSGAQVAPILWAAETHEVAPGTGGRSRTGGDPARLVSPATDVVAGLHEVFSAPMSSSSLGFMMSLCVQKMLKIDECLDNEGLAESSISGPRHMSAGSKHQKYDLAIARWERLSTQPASAHGKTFLEGEKKPAAWHY